MNSGILHLAYTSFSLLIAVGIYSAYRRGGSANKQLRDFSLFFLLFSVYRLFLSSSLLSNNLIVMQWSYNAAIAIFFVMISIAWKIPLSILGLNAKRIRILLGSLMVIGLMVILIQICDPRLPIMDSSSFIFWNANPFAAWITSLAGFLVAMTWVYTFSKNFSGNIDPIEKLKTALIVAAAFMIGIGSLTYFHSCHLLLTLTTFVVMFISSVCLLLVILISLLRRLLKRKKIAGDES